MPKITELPAAVSVGVADLLPVVTDPAGTPTTRSATIAQIRGVTPGAAGTATVDFLSFPGDTMASVVVTGQTGIASGSTVRAWLRPSDTAVHSADEHIIAATLLDVVVSDIVAGTGFTIHVLARDMGGSRLEPPGIGRWHYAVLNATSVGANNGVQSTVVGSVGGTALNTHWGTYTLNWEWR